MHGSVSHIHTMERPSPNQNTWELSPVNSETCAGEEEQAQSHACLVLRRFPPTYPPSWPQPPPTHTLCYTGHPTGEHGEIRTNPSHWEINNHRAGPKVAGSRTSSLGSQDSMLNAVRMTWMEREEILAGRHQ